MYLYGMRETFWQEYYAYACVQWGMGRLSPVPPAPVPPGGLHMRMPGGVHRYALSPIRPDSHLVLRLALVGGKVLQQQQLRWLKAPPFLDVVVEVGTH